MIDFSQCMVGGEDNNNANQFIVRMPNVLHADQSFYPDSISSLNSNTILSSKIRLYVVLTKHV